MNIIKEIGIICLAAFAISIAYNFTQPEPIPLIREEKPIASIDDSILFDSLAAEITNPVIIDSNSSKGTLTSIIDSSKAISGLTKKADSLIVSANGMGDVKNNQQKIADAHLNLGKTLTYEQMLKVIANPSFLIIDARSPENYSKNKIGNAINIFPYGDEGEMMNLIMGLPTDKKIIIYCDGGHCDASHKLAEIVLSFGYEKVYIYTGGWEEWTLKKGLKK